MSDYLTGKVDVDNIPAVQVVTIADQPIEVSIVPAVLTWSYYAGVSGTLIVTAGQKVRGIGCHSTTSGYFTINSGMQIPIPAGIGINIEPNGELIAPTIVFVGTDSYFVEVAQ